MSTDRKLGIGLMAVSALIFAYEGFNFTAWYKDVWGISTIGTGLALYFKGAQ